MSDLLKNLGKDVAFCFVPVPGSHLNKMSKVAKTSKAIVEAAKAAGIVRGASAGVAAVGSVLTTPPASTTSTPVIQEVTPVPREKGNIDIYQSFNPKTGEVQYVGITNNLPRRAKEHLRSKRIKIQRIDGLTDLTRGDAKAIEQVLIEIHELEKNGGTLVNKINSIAESNPKFADSLIRGAKILQEEGCSIE